MVCNYSCAKNGSVDIFEKFLLFSIFGSILHPWPLERGGSKMRDFELKCRFVFPPNPPQPPPMQKHPPPPLEENSSLHWGNRGHKDILTVPVTT